MHALQTSLSGNDDKYLVPKTEGIKYAGSKLKILPYIINEIAEIKGVKTILDGFSGSTRISQVLAQNGYKIISNDIAEWSNCFANCYLKANKSNGFYQKIIHHLNSLKGEIGWFSENYGADIDSELKRPFQLKNTMKLDAIRREIDMLDLEQNNKCVILTSLILALDSVDSTLGHYASYLKNWSPRSYNDLYLKLPNLFAVAPEDHIVLKQNIFDVINHYEVDLAYFDPPYGSNNEKMPASRVRYNSYYHIWKTVILNDKPELFGRANRREDSRDTAGVSPFEEFKKDKNGNFIAMNAIKEMIQKTKAKYIMLSYSSGGRATMEQLSDIMNSCGTLIKTISINHKKNVMANMCWTNDWSVKDDSNQEYIFILKK